MLQALHLTDLTHPAFQTVILLAVGLLCICVRQYRTATVFGVLGVSWIILCATPAFAGLLRRGLESAFPLRQARNYPAVDAIVVLGGGDPPDFDHANDKARSTRTGFALELYREGRAPIILVSGGGAGEATEMAPQLEQQGVPAMALRFEPISVTTYQNALYSALVLNREHLHRILLVTSTVPMRRAVACFEHLGLDVIPAPVFDAHQTPIPGAAWRPQCAVLFESQRYLHEYIGLLVYKLRGWI